MINRHHNDSQQKIDQLIEGVAVDCHDDNEYEQAILESVQDNITCPFKSQVLGFEVQVIGIKQIGNQFKAVCQKDWKA